MAPGSISLTVTPVPSRSMAIDSLQPASANFEPEYAASAVIPRRPPRLETLTIIPDAAREHPREQRQRDGDGGEVVDPHRPLDLVHGEAGDVPAHGDGGVVDHDVESPEVVPDLERQVRRRRRVRESAAQRAEAGRGGPAVGEHLVQTVGPARHQGDGVTPGRQLTCQRRRRCPTTRRSRGPCGPASQDPLRTSPSQTAGRVPATHGVPASFGVSEGSRTPDLQDHNLAL